jgi:type I restriction enzyme S subunit
MRETLVKSEEFKDSPWEKLPKDWKLVSLEDFVQSSEGIKPGPFGSSITKANYTSSGYRVYGQEQVIAGELSVGDYFISTSKYHELRAFAVQDNDILLSLVGTTGKVLVVRKPFHNGVINPRLIRLRPDLNITDIEYLKHLLESSLVRYQLNRIAQGGTMEVLSATVLRRLRLPKPELWEQRRIAEILDTINSTIAHTSSLIAKLKQMKAGLLHDLLTRGLDENGELRDAIGHPEQFKDSPLGRIPKNWEVCQLRDFYAVPARNGLYKPTNFYGRGVLMIHMPQMFRGFTIDVSDAARVDVNPSELERFSLAVGDLVFARRSLNLEGAGRCSLVPALSEPTTFESSIIRVRLLTDKLRPIFANYFLNSETGFRLRLPLIRQVAVSGVSSEDIASIPVPCPPSEEQDAIIKIIDTHDSRIRTEQAYRDKLKLQKQGLMHDLLTGKVRVKDADKSTSVGDTV